jgi:hypothetical protein
MRLAVSQRLIRTTAVLLTAVVLAPGRPTAVAQTAAARQAGTPPSAAAHPASNDLDAFMARVLQRRDENWRKLHDYILSETESFAIEGPGNLPLNGFKREYAWYVREGYLVRSPLRYDGAATPEAERRKYEENWLKREKERDERARSKAKTAPAAEPAPAQGKSDVPSLEQFVDQRGEPRFVSEAYFLQFKFEPGNYYLAGRDRIADRDVLKIEYYPTALFSDEHREGDKPAPTETPKKGKAAKPKDRESDEDAEIERKLNKVAMVTLWVDPAEYQIVRYTFENTDFGFLPGRWLVRVGDISASMTMSRVLDGVWLPGQISMKGDVTFATGRYGFTYGRTFYDYKKAEVGARVRILGPERK